MNKPASKKKKSVTSKPSPAKKAPAKKAPVKKTPAKKVSSKKIIVQKSAAKKSVSKTKTPQKTPASSKTTSSKTASSKTASSKNMSKKIKKAVKKTVTKKTAASQNLTKNTPTKKISKKVKKVMPKNSGMSDKPFKESRAQNKALSQKEHMKNTHQEKPKKPKNRHPLKVAVAITKTTPQQPKSQEKVIDFSKFAEEVPTEVVDPGFLTNDDVFDETDLAQWQQLREQAAIHARAINLNKPEKHPDFDGTHCIECDIEIPPARLALNKVRCVDCQSEIEQKNKILNRGVSNTPDSGMWDS